MKKPPHIERLPGSGLLRVRIPDPFRKGERITVTGHNEASVLARVDQIRRTIEDWKLGAIGPEECRRAINRVALGAPTLRDVYDAYNRTLRGEWGEVKVPAIWKSRLGPYFEKSKVFELTAERMAAWERSELDKGLSPKTIVNAFHCVRAAVRLSMLQSGGTSLYPWLTWRPQGLAKNSEQSQRSAAVSLDELRALMHAANRYDQWLESKGIFADVALRIFTAALAGTRMGEMAALGWDHVLLPDHAQAGEAVQGMIRIWKNTRPNWRTRHPTWTRPLDDPKGKRHRGHGLHPELARALYDHRERLKRRFSKKTGKSWYAPDGPVFPVMGPKGEGVWRSQPGALNGRVFRQIVQVAGFVGGKWSPHSLRHTFCTLTARAAWQATGDLVAARILTGHQDQKTLDAYLHRASEAMPQSLIGELGQASLPGILSPKLLEVGEIVAEAREIDRKLTGIAAAIVVPDREPELSSMTLVELAQRFPSDTPKAVIHRADARYRRAYNEAKRDGKDVEVCKERGTRARHGFMSAWRKAQQKARAELAKAGE
jgi:integrase